MLHVIYDGQCGFCVRSMRLARALDVRRALQFHDAAPPDAVRAKFSGLADADFENAMFAVAPDGTVTRGFFAFRRLLRESPLLWPLLLLCHLPGADAVGPRMYARVARNRQRFGCATEVCPPAAPPGGAPRNR